jgi:hypothetical protein
MPRILRSYEATVEIDAPAARVWEILVDLPSYGAWNTFCPVVESTLTVGGPVVLHVHLGKRRVVQRETVRAVDAEGLRLCWGATIGPPFVFHGDRWQELTALGPDRCRYHTHERFTGLLSPLVGALFGRAVQEGFSTMAADLKRRAEMR